MLMLFLKPWTLILLSVGICNYPNVFIFIFIEFLHLYIYIFTNVFFPFFPLNKKIFYNLYFAYLFPLYILFFPYSSLSLPLLPSHVSHLDTDSWYSCLFLSRSSLGYRPSCFFIITSSTFSIRCNSSFVFGFLSVLPFFLWVSPLISTRYNSLSSTNWNSYYSVPLMLLCKLNQNRKWRCERFW